VTARPSGTELTRIEHLMLWHAAHGHTYASMARSLGYTRQSAANIGVRIVRKLGAANITNAVYLAVSNNLIGTHPDCGDRAAYLRHLRSKEPPCRACKNANATHAVAQRAGLLKDAA
jgi:DNA-binding CsgD family transcriptional regulator